MSRILNRSAAFLIIGSLVGGTALVAAAPSNAYTRYVCKYEQKRREHTGTVVGAIAGGLLGNAVSGHNKGVGTVVGAVGGAAIGSKMGHDSGKRACTQASAYRTSTVYSRDSHGNRVKTVYRYVRE